MNVKLVSIVRQLVFILAVSCISLPDLAPAKTVHNFVYFGQNRESISKAEFLDTPAFEGAQLSYTWKELEHGENGYDFGSIRADLTYLQQHGKKLFIQLRDASFDVRYNPIPKYLLKNPEYHGGASYQYDNDGQKPAGWVARRWDPAVQDRFHKLLAALAAEFDDEIEGINLQETAIGLSEGTAKTPSDFTYEAYRNGILANMMALKNTFQKTIVMQYANFMPGEWLPDNDHGFLSSLYQFGEENGVAMGSPDLMPKSQNQLNNPYKMMHAMKDIVPVAIAVQDGNYIGKTGDDTPPKGDWPNIVPDLDEFAQSYLRVDYIFWGYEEPYFTHDVVPYFNHGS